MRVRVSPSPPYNLMDLNELIISQAFKLHNIRGDKHCMEFTPILIFPRECNCLEEARLIVEYIVDKQDEGLCKLFRERQA